MIERWKRPAHPSYPNPVWLLRQYNPDLDFGALQAGMWITVPRLERRQPWDAESGDEAKLTRTTSAG